MNADPRARWDVAELRSDERIDAGRGAGCEIIQLGFERFPELHQGPTIFLARRCASCGNGPRHPGGHLSLAQKPADLERRRTLPARRVKENRQSAAFQTDQKRAQAPRRTGVEGALCCDPLAAAWAQA